MTVWLLRETNLFYFHIGPVSDLVHGKSNAYGISLIIKFNFSERCVHIICAEGFSYLLVICRTRILNSIKKRLSACIAVQEEGSWFRAVCFLMRLYGGNSQRVFRCVFMARRIDPFGISSCHLDKSVILDAVIGDKECLQTFLAHLRDYRGGLRVITAIYDCFRTRLLDFLNYGGVVNSALRYSLKEDDGSFFRILDVPLRFFRESLAVVAFVMQDRYLFQIEILDGKIYGQLCLVLVVTDCPVKVGILAA